MASNTAATVLTAVVSLVVVGSIVAPCKANTLFCGVTHSEVVPAANTRYPIAPLSEETPEGGAVRGGVPIRPTLRNPIVEWVQIPKWMAGKWTKQGDLTVSYTNLRTGVTKSLKEWTENVETITWGNQFDGRGNIWQGYFIPWERDGMSNGKSVRFIIVSLKREVTSSEQVVTRVHSIVSESLGTQVVDAFQQESLNDYFLLPSGELENHSSNRDFTNAGQPIREGMLVSRFTKVGPFVPKVTHNGVDMLKSLNDYFRAHNMSQLVRRGP
jgi:hypothetical protein